MYESFFGFREQPFSLTPDPRFLWLSETHQEGLAALIYGITRRKGFLMLTGEVGTGKTTLLRAALGQIPPDTDTALVLNTIGLTPIDLLKLIGAEFGLQGRLESTADYVIALNRMLLQRLRAGRNTVLIIDEAQNLEAGALEEIRLLSNLETDTEKLMQIVLTGQPELLHKLDSPSLRQLRQRIAVEHHMEPLRSDQVGPYLAHRIGVAGGKYPDVFMPGAEATFYAFSVGCPRLISLLADRVLLAAFAKQLRPIPPEFVETKAKSMAATRAAGMSDSLTTGD
jgi:general secretion pathway protein A